MAARALSWAQAPPSSVRTNVHLLPWLARAEPFARLVCLLDISTLRPAAQTARPKVALDGRKFAPSRTTSIGMQSFVGLRACRLHCRLESSREAPKRRVLIKPPINLQGWPAADRPVVLVCPRDSNWPGVFRSECRLIRPRRRRDWADETTLGLLELDANHELLYLV